MKSSVLFEKLQRINLLEMIKDDRGQHFLENLQLVPYPCVLYNVTVNFTEGSGRMLLLNSSGNDRYVHPFSPLDKEAQRGKETFLNHQGPWAAKPWLWLFLPQRPSASFLALCLETRPSEVMNFLKLSLLKSFWCLAPRIILCLSGRYFGIVFQNFPPTQAKEREGRERVGLSPRGAFAGNLLGKVSSWRLQPCFNSSQYFPALVPNSCS